MLSEYIGVNIFLRYAIVLGKSAAETGSVQCSSGTKDLALRKTGNFCKCIRHNVTWITYNNIKRLRSHLYDLRSDTFHDVDISLCQLDTCLSWLSGNTGSDDDNIRISCIRIISCHDGDRFTETGSLVNVHDLALCLLFVDVDQDDF